MLETLKEVVFRQDIKVDMGGVENVNEDVK